MEIYSAIQFRFYRLTRISNESGEEMKGLMDFFYKEKGSATGLFIACVAGVLFIGSIVYIAASGTASSIKNRNQRLENELQEVRPTEQAPAQPAQTDQVSGGGGASFGDGGKSSEPVHYDSGSGGSSGCPDGSGD